MCSHRATSPIALSGLYSSGPWAVADVGDSLRRLSSLQHIIFNSVVASKTPPLACFSDDWKCPKLSLAPTDFGIWYGDTAIETTVKLNATDSLVNICWFQLAVDLCHRRYSSIHCRVQPESMVTIHSPFVCVCVLLRIMALFNFCTYTRIPMWMCRFSVA